MHLSTKFGDSSSTSSKVIERTSALPLVTHIRNPVRKRRSPKKKHKNGAFYEEKYEQHFCARREESNGLCFRSIRPILFELWPKMWIWRLTSGELLDRKWNSKTRHMGGKPFTSSTFWSLFGVNRPSSFWDMDNQSFWPFDLWWPWPLALTSQNQ